jgi:hypothetical protein
MPFSGFGASSGQVHSHGHLPLPHCAGRTSEKASSGRRSRSYSILFWGSAVVARPADLARQWPRRVASRSCARPCRADRRGGDRIRNSTPAHPARGLFTGVCGRLILRTAPFSCPIHRKFIAICSNEDVGLAERAVRWRSRRWKVNPVTAGLAASSWQS